MRNTETFPIFLDIKKFPDSHAILFYFLIYIEKKDHFYFHNSKNSIKQKHLIFYGQIL